MLGEEKNRQLTQVGPGTPMGELLRRYWHPVAGMSEFDDRATKPVRLLGEDLVLYKDLSGTFGLIERHCPHRRADLAYGMVEVCGLRCNYHGWRFDETGACREQPHEDTAHPELKMREKIVAVAYPVQAKAGMLWAYMGPAPAPLLPDWEAFSWPNGFTQVVVSEVPCNWFQCQENSIDPVHFEWMHENWAKRLAGGSGYGPTHLKLDFEEFEFGFVYKRIKEDTDATHGNWTTGRVCLWPNGFFLGEHFEWRVPVDDENTLSITWKFTRVPREREPYEQTSIPTWHGPTHDAEGRWITSHVMNQDFLAWAGQGVIADRTREHLGTSDRGITMIRRRFFDEMTRIANGEEAKGVVRDAARNVRVELPMMNRADTLDGYTTAEILADPRKRMLFTSYVFQAGQPERVKRLFSEAMGVEPVEFQGFQSVRPKADAPPDGDRMRQDYSARLLALDTPTLSDALDKLGLAGAVHGLASLTVPRKIAGRVRTVKLGAPPEGLAKRHLGVGAVMASDPGDVIVVENQGRTDVSGWGGLLSRGAVQRGVAGVIVDGAFRDIDEARELGLPIFARAAAPITARGRVAEHSSGEPITVAGLAVMPDDWVLADGSGIAFICGARLEEILATAEEIFSREQLMASDIDAGRPLSEVMGANYEGMLKSRAGA